MSSLAPFQASAQEIVQPIPQQSSDMESGFHRYLDSLRGKAAAMGISAATMNQVFPTLSYNPRVIQLDQSQPGGSFDSPIPPFEPYRRKHVDASRIRGGQVAYRANRSKLMQIERETGVPESIMVAIFGHETNYGRFTGDFDLLRSLATLAYEGRRRTLFEPEFLAALKILDNGIPREKLVGSWAGAMGYPQFLPSVYLRVARDGDGDGKADIWSSQADALASIANYFVDAGWRKGIPWGIAVAVPSTIDRAAIANHTIPPRCPRVFERHSKWMTMTEWRRLGVMPLGGESLRSDVLATLLEPDGPGKTAYLLTSNYQAILDYNCSNFYALSVGLLANAVDD
ncbi:MAG: lytic murein transglycosylase [Sphingobium sp.]|nr:lytic murein transglycosylase [Sphingobium sp.]MCP5398905.1 lytic murein transglycosylase [Sphingomonas sp.]